MAAMQPGVWGIDIGQCGVKAIRLEEIDGEWTAIAFDYIEYPKILTQPDADPDQLIREALEQFLSRNEIRGDLVAISVPGQSGLARFVKLPPVEERKIADIVRFEAKQQIPFPLEEVVWDYQKLGAGEVTDGFAMGTEIGLFALKRDMVFRYLQHFKDVGIEVHLVQMAPLALCNFVAYDLLADEDREDEDEDVEDAGKKKCVVALDIGTDNSNLVITDGDCIIWQRPIPLGGNHFTRALTKDMKLTFAKAEHLKRNAVKSPDLRKILSSLKTVLNDFVGEVQRSLGYFTNTHRDAKVQYMIGLGNAFRLPGLQKYLQEKLQLEVRKFTKLARVESDDEVAGAPTFTSNLPSFAVAYGLALQGTKKTRLQTNLLPYEVRVERLVRDKKPWALAAAASLLLAVAGLAMAAGLELGGLSSKDMIDGKAMALKAQKDKANLDKEYKDAEDEVNEANTALRRLAAGVDERWNWQLLEQYINLALPQPDATRVFEKTLSKDTPRKDYYNENAKEAHRLLEEKRNSDKELDLSKSKQRDDKIKRHLIQVNIESITARYSDDLSGFFRKLAESELTLFGMKEEERLRLNTAYGKTAKDDKTKQTEAQAGLPQNGWVVEIRGYTYHNQTFQFVTNTFVENLNRFNDVPDNAAILDKPFPPGSAETLRSMIAERIEKKKSYLFVYSNRSVDNPKPGKFEIIGKTHLTELLNPGDDKDKKTGVPGKEKEKGGSATVKKGKGAEKKIVVKNRTNWIPASFASRSKATKDEKTTTSGKGGNTPSGSGAGGAVPKRTEFVIMFVWQEAFLPEEAESGPAVTGVPAQGGQPARGTPAGGTPASGTPTKK